MKFKTSGVCSRAIDEAIRRMDGIKCGYKDTSCPDQLAKALKEYKKDNE